MSKIKANTIENVAGTETHSVDTMGIESGSNANGEYIKFPDGTLICTYTVTTNSGAVGTTLLANWVFPFAFISNPTMSVCVLTSSPEFYITSGIVRDNINADVYCHNNGTQTIDRTLYLQAIGRWK